MEENEPTRVKGSPEWRASCGDKNKDNAHAVKHGKYVRKPLMCSKECKISNICPYFESCEGEECIELIKEKEEIENVLKKKEELLSRRININSVRLEIADRICKKNGYIDYTDLYPMEKHLIELMEKLEKGMNKD
ncbi:MAG: hypothetical protein K9N07_10310 [Candidatus Cloacimonetes bacterium]|nr:hypothetical protein [Candidatus Cloacimonadota bacterium]MCF8014061.1 hypothetical protein [Candidatus Woesearchaeota archaeon]